MGDRGESDEILHGKRVEIKLNDSGARKVLEREMDARVPLEPRHEDCEAADIIHNE